MHRKTEVPIHAIALAPMSLRRAARVSVRLDRMRLLICDVVHRGNRDAQIFRASRRSQVRDRTLLALSRLSSRTQGNEP